MEGSKLSTENVYVHLNRSLSHLKYWIKINNTLKRKVKQKKIPRKFLSNVNIKEMILELFLKNTIICRFFNKKGVF
jgi:hypothetical protein